MSLTKENLLFCMTPRQYNEFVEKFNLTMSYCNNHNYNEVLNSFVSHILNEHTRTTR
jgi:hypothetical protein